MADYKRMVSYMYQYDNGVKRKNVGYARIEARGGQIKITLHMQLLGQLDSIFPTYLIQRDNLSVNLIYLGDAVLKNQIMDSRLMADENNIMNTGHKLSEMGGLLLFMHDNIFFASEWDDKPIVASDLLEALKPKKQELPPEEGLTAAVSNWELQMPEPLSPEGFSLTEEISMPKYKLPRGWKTVERLGQPIPTAAETTDQILEAAVVKSHPEEDSITNIIMDIEAEILGAEVIEAEVTKDQKLEEVVTEDQNSEAEVMEADVAADALIKNRVDEASERPENPVAKHLFDIYPRIYPFEDNEIILCVKIEPKDIGMLPKELWGLSNNSFLMHGFYCYHHLIFAKLKDRNGCRYILGIPGIYHNRERFMARMFGFENFKSIRKRELQQGDFGYWHLDVNF